MPAPANDLIANAQLVTISPTPVTPNVISTITGTLVGATGTEDLGGGVTGGLSTGNAGYPSVWYKFQPAADTVVALSVVSTGGVLGNGQLEAAIFSGPASPTINTLDTQMRIGAGAGTTAYFIEPWISVLGPGGLPSGTGPARMLARAGQWYYIYVAAYYEDTFAIALTVAPPTPVSISGDWRPSNIQSLGRYVGGWNDGGGNAPANFHTDAQWNTANVDHWDVQMTQLDASGKPYNDLSIGVTNSGEFPPYPAPGRLVRPEHIGLHTEPKLVDTTYVFALIEYADPSGSTTTHVTSIDCNPVGTVSWSLIQKFQLGTAGLAHEFWLGKVIDEIDYPPGGPAPYWTVHLSAAVNGQKYAYFHAFHGLSTSSPVAGVDTYTATLSSTPTPASVNRNVDFGSMLANRKGLIAVLWTSHVSTAFGSGGMNSYNSGLNPINQSMPDFNASNGTLEFYGQGKAQSSDRMVSDRADQNGGSLNCLRRLVFADYRLSPYPGYPLSGIRDVGFFRGGLGDMTGKHGIMSVLLKGAPQS